MKDAVLSAPTKSKNVYALSKSKSMLRYCSPHTEDEDEYYRKKYDYLQKYLYRDTFEYSNSMRISPETIRNKVVNLQQLVFEVTDACNLKCKYCGYGEFYNDYDKRNNKKLEIENVKPLLEYLLKLWKETEFHESFDKVTFISFYGGEPLLNMPFIEEVVCFFKNLNIKGRRFIFSMTTNAILLNRYIDFIAGNQFDLLISLDGNTDNNAYRQDASGKNSFSRIIENADLLKSRYPDYFNECVNFNAVLHNKNSVSEIFDFFQSRYNKIPAISELNNMGIKPEKQDEFDAMYKNSMESLYQSENYKAIEHDMFTKIGSYHEASVFIHQYSGYVFRTYNDLLIKKEKRKFLPTGTCLPFGKKFFVTVNGKILPCERIGQQFALGKVEKNEVLIDYEYIADKYNNYFDKLKSQCSTCYRADSCIQCIFNIDNLDNKPLCHGYMNRDFFSRYLAHNMNFLEEHPEDYSRIMKDVVVV